MISSRVIKESLKLLESTVTVRRHVKPSYQKEAPAKSHCWKNDTCCWRLHFAKEHIGLKRNGAKFLTKMYGLMKARLFFLDLGLQFVRWPPNTIQATVHCEDGEEMFSRIFNRLCFTPWVASAISRSKSKISVEPSKLMQWNPGSRGNDCQR